jgi:hypothetical protein
MWTQIFTIAVGDGYLAVASNPATKQFVADEGHIADAYINVFVIFALIAALFASQAGSRFNKAVSARRNRDFKLLLGLITARTSVTIKQANVWIALVVIAFMHLQHYENVVAAFMVHFLLTSVVVLVVLTLRDLDDPLTGVASIGEIPDDLKNDVAVVLGGYKTAEQLCEEEERAAMFRRLNEHSSLSVAVTQTTTTEINVAKEEMDELDEIDVA